MAHAFDGFGEAVAISGDRLVVSAVNDDGTAPYSGSAYVFERNGLGDWIQVDKLLASDGVEGHGFGQSVGISGDRVVVGATGDSEQGPYAGAAYVFERGVSGDWTQVDKLLASDGAASTGHTRASPFRSAAAGSRSVLVYASGNVPTSGAVYVFKRDVTGDWVETDKLVAADGAAYDFFGRAVAISGDRVAVGASSDDNIRGSEAGAAYVFELAPLNVAPTVDAGTAGPAAEGATVTLAGSVTDPDDATPTIAWSATPGADVDAGATCTFTDSSLAHERRQLHRRRHLDPDPLRRRRDESVRQRQPHPVRHQRRPGGRRRSRPVRHHRRPGHPRPGHVHRRRCQRHPHRHHRLGRRHAGRARRRDPGRGLRLRHGPSHTYAASGLFTATVTVTDDDGGTDDRHGQDVGARPALRDRLPRQHDGPGHGAPSLSLARPAAALTGDVLIASIDVRTTPTIGAPTGWTLIRSDASNIQDDEGHVLAPRRRRAIRRPTPGRSPRAPTPRPSCSPTVGSMAPRRSMPTAAASQLVERSDQARVDHDDGPGDDARRPVRVGGASTFTPPAGMTERADVAQTTGGTGGQGVLLRRRRTPPDRRCHR